MENEIRIINGKKQVKKGKTWRLCCVIENCINRADKEICNYHKCIYPILQTLDKKSKEDKVKDILKLKEIEINNLYDYKDKNLSKNKDKCTFICYCGKQDTKIINQILNVSGFNCKECTKINTNIKIKNTHSEKNNSNIQHWKLRRVPFNFWNKLENRKKYIDWFIKEKISNLNELYNITTKLLCDNYGNGIVKFYKSSILEILNELVIPPIEDGEWLPWKLKRVPTGFWNDIKNIKKAIKWLEKKIDIKKPEDWYEKICKEVFENNNLGGLRTIKYSKCPLYHILIDTIEPPIEDGEWLSWKFKKRRTSKWDKLEDRIKYMKCLEKKLNITKSEDWYNFSTQNIKEICKDNTFTNLADCKYKGSVISLIIDTIKPPEEDGKWLIWKFKNSQINNYWKNKDNQIKYMKWLEEKLNITNPENWYDKNLYKILKDNYGDGLCAGYYEHCSIELLKNTIKPPEEDGEWLYWKFKKTPQNYWKKKENHLKYLLWLEKKKNITNKKQWYKLFSQKLFLDNYGGGLIDTYNGSIIDIIYILEPPKEDGEWLLWKFEVSLIKNFWNIKNNQIKFMKWLEKELNIQKPEEWYKIKKDDIQNNFGNGICHEYLKLGLTYQEMIISIFPDYNLDIKKFTRFGKLEYECMEYLKLNIYPNLIYGSKKKQKKININRYRFYLCDGYDETNNLVLEFHGDYWHGNPKKFDVNNIFCYKKNKKEIIMGEKFWKTISKEILIRKKGYNYGCIWESEYLKGNKKLIIPKKFPNFLED
jgi:hypothetical protein